MKNFENKIVVVTGAGSGMGRAYATEFARLGAKLALNDYDAEALAETVELLNSQGARVYMEAFDVADAAAMDRFAVNVKNELGDAHVVINNAGIEGAQKPGWVICNAEHERIMGINFYGVVNGTRAFMPQLLANDEGAVINVSSVFGLIGTPNSGDYCASKFAVRGFTESLMVELQDSHVNAFCVHPGGIATNIVRSEEGQDFKDRYLTTPPEDIVKYVIKSMGCGRVRIVYGQSSFRIWFASRFVPLRWLIRILWREMKTITDLTHYPQAKK